MFRQLFSLDKVVLACMLGNALEWYDFIIYSYFAGTIGALFFPLSDPSVQIMLSFSVFAMGFVARPIGAILFGHIGDKFSRKSALTLSIYLMAIPTFLIAILPTYESIGILAPLLLIVMRLFQGIAIGGEFTGSMVFIVEHASKHERARSGSWASFSLVVGVVIGSCVATLIKASLSAEQVSSYGWRMAFCLSIFGAIVGAFIRKSLTDPVSFTKHKAALTEQKSPLILLIKNYMPHMLLVILVDFVTAIGFFLLVMFLPNFFERHLLLSPSIALSINTLNMVMFAGFILLGGRLSDIWGRKLILNITCFALVVLAIPIFGLFLANNLFFIFLGQLLLAAIIGIFFGQIPAMLSEIFPTRVRFSGLSLAHNISMGIFGGTTPLVAEYLIKETQSLLSPSYMLIVAGLLSLLAAPFIIDKHNQELD